MSVSHSVCLYVCLYVCMHTCMQLPCLFNMPAACRRPNKCPAARLEYLLHPSQHASRHHTCSHCARGRLVLHLLPRARELRSVLSSCLSRRRCFFVSLGPSVARTHPHANAFSVNFIHYMNHVIKSLQVSVMASAKPPLVVMGRDHAHSGSSQHVSSQSPLAGGSGTGSVGSRTPMTGRSRGLSHGAVDSRDDRTKWREARRKQRAVFQRNKEERKLRVTQKQRLGVCLPLCMRACVCLCAWSGSSGDGHEPIISHSAAGVEQRSEESIRVSVLAVKSPAGAKLQVPSDPEGGKAQRRRLVSLLNVKATPANLELER